MEKVELQSIVGGALQEKFDRAWQNEAMKNIKEYLEEQLKDYSMFKVIS